jgi:NDP-sugar pyrophosphorylase family protein
MSFVKAMILAAGYGERLWPLTADRTKPALPVLGKPLVGYVAEYLARFGIDEAIVNLHHQPQSVREALGDGSRFGVRLRYVHEPVILGTSGALDNARDLLGEETFVVINGKVITDIDLAAALKTHRAKNALATLVLKKNLTRERFSLVETREGFITRFGGMPEPVTDDANSFSDLNLDPPLMFTGIQILEPRIFDYIPRGVFSHSTTDVYPRAIASGERIAAHVADGMWYELSTLQRYLAICLALLQREGRSIDVGVNCQINVDADVQDSILWNNVVIEKSARLRRAVVGDGACIRSGEEFENQIVVRADLVAGKEPPKKALKGRVKGENFVVPLSQ